MITIMYAGAKMSIWNLIFSDKPDDSYNGEMIGISTKTPSGYEGSRGGGGLILPKNMVSCLFYLILVILGMWAAADFSQSLDEPSRVITCASGSIWPWDSCR